MSSSSNILSIVDELMRTMPLLQVGTWLEAKALETPFVVSAPDQDMAFLKLSGILDEGDNVLVKWDSVKDWLFNANDNQTPETMLKAMVRTQIYRPLFFKPDNHVDFTDDATAYRCLTDKFYIDHNGTRQKLAFIDGSWDVNRGDSGLGDTEEYNVRDVQYSLNLNQLGYTIQYQPISVVDNKFVYDDVEFYVVLNMDPGNELYNKPIAIWFNEFQKETQTKLD